MSKETSVIISDALGKLVPKYSEPQPSRKIELQNFNLIFNDLPESFNGFKICHLSDLHNANLFGKKPDLLEKISQEKPDIFIISGDSINNNQINNATKTILTLKSVVDPKNIFIVAGNHEFYRENHQEKSKIRNFIEILQENKINILLNDSREIERNGDSIFIMGVEDPLGFKNETQYLKDSLDYLIDKIPSDKFKILISHRPEKINLYSQYEIKLVFSGHAHGGQIKFFNQGLFAPNQGLFPKYTEGVHTRKNLQEIVSPGLSNEYIFPRLNNPGKIYFITLNNSN